MKKLLYYIIALCVNFSLISGCKTEKKRELSGYDFNKEYIEINVGISDQLTGDITVDMHVKLHCYPRSWTSLIYEEHIDDGIRFNLRIRREDSGQWYYFNEQNAILDWKPSEVMHLNEWVRITAVRNHNDKVLELFINGKSVAKRTFESLPLSEISDSKIYILRQDRRTLDATIADVRIWSRALSLREIKQTYPPLNNPSKQKDLVGYWLFDNIINDTVYDKSGNNMNAIIRMF